MKPISPLGLPIGISISIWSVVGVLRYIAKMFNKKKAHKTHYKRKDIAVLLPAHNEEVVIRSSIQALKEIIPSQQIYVVSDGSIDKTYRRARMEGCHVSKLLPGRGKAKALVYLLKTHRLFERFKLIFIVDADTRIDENCIRRMLPIFNDPEVGVVFASSQIHWPQHLIPKLSYYFVSYRDRLNRLLQYCYIYGQTWKYTNVNYVIPGFATMYRSEVLQKLEIDTPGLLIEDFNLAFQFHKKKLGKIGYDHGLVGWDQYPTNLSDYWKQVKRWNIGFFQTVRKNGVWPSMFWLALGIFMLEVTLHSFFLLFIPFLALYLIALITPIHHPLVSSYINFYSEFGLFKYVSLRDIIISVFLIDYLTTVIVALLGRKPQFLFYGLFFFFMHYVTSLILINSIIPGFFGSSSGRWVSPKRQRA